MSNFSSIAEDTPAHTYEVTVDTVSASVTSQARIKDWHVEILLLVVGLLALAFFIALGDVFAVLGPWVIYLGVLSVRKRSGWARYVLRIITGASLACLSAAALLLAKQIELWCMAGGILGLLSGLVYLATTLYEMRRAIIPFP